MRSDPTAASATSPRRLVLLAMAMVSVLLVACGGDDGGSEPASAAGATTTGVAEAATTAPPASTSPVGDRVVVLAEEFVLADVLALGIEPVASTAAVVEVGFQGLDGYETGGIEVLPMTSLNIEHLASIRPDTIVTLQFWVDQIGEDVLRGTADLLVIPDGLSNAERLTVLGELLGRPDEAAAVRADLETAMRRADDAVPDDCVVSLAAIYPGPSPAAFVAGPWEIPTSILATGCALDPDPTVATPDQNGRVFLSLEELGILDAPKLVLLQSPAVEGEDAAVDEIAANPLWVQLPAVRSGDVVTFDRLGYPGASGQIRFLEEFAALFAAN
jgi:iron complex transport system substrate-binding protein